LKLPRATLAACLVAAIVAGELRAEPDETTTNALVYGLPVVVGLYGLNTWWNDGLGRFRTIDEGWFGQDSYAGGVDKLGHAYSAYLSARLLTRALEWADNDPATSQRLAATSALGTFLGLEVIDGFSQKIRFSIQDAVASAAGVGLAVLLERDPKLDAMFDLRLAYKRSDDARRLGVRDPVSDYTGQTYFFSFKPSGVAALNRGALRFLELDIGYAARGYEPRDTHSGPGSRYRYIGLSLDFATIIDTLAAPGPNPSRWRRAAGGIFEYFQVPGVGIFRDHKL
jgi:hypothetical protein